jgi:hypothetical protein
MKSKIYLGMFFLLVLLSCTKKENDYRDKIVGIYNCDLKYIFRRVGHLDEITYLHDTLSVFKSGDQKIQSDKKFSHLIQIGAI